MGPLYYYFFPLVRRFITACRDELSMISLNMYLTNLVAEKYP